MRRFTRTAPHVGAALPRVVLALTLLLAPRAVRAGAWESIERLPGEGPVSVQVNGQPRTYFRVTAGRPFSIAIEGPARLRVTSRVELPTGSTEVATYALRVTEGANVLGQQRTESSASSLVSLPDGAHAVAKSRRMTVDIPKGRHQVLIAAEGPHAVLVRLQQAAPARGEQPMVTLTPVDAARSVTVTEGEKTIPYYTALPGKPVKLRVVGPTTLDLLTRLDFEQTMRGTQVYRLVVSEQGRRLREVEFKTTKATTAVYGNLRDRVPSKFDRLRLTIGEGLHEIAIELITPAGGAAEIHARIPEPTTGGEE